MGGRLPIQQKDRRRSYIDRLQKNLSQWWQTLSRPLQSSNLTNVNERKGTTYISTSSCLRSEQKPLINYDSDSEVRIFGCFVLDPCGSACCATSLNQRYPRISSTRYLEQAAEKIGGWKLCYSSTLAVLWQHNVNSALKPESSGGS
ncbi:unnamed protein product [Lupinus luteus]|uniref:Uncharacterized protein n=1 Tax=Lupinus luteus TaxID=3873 RepID=A0AAV1VXK3_LUPLU